jgi:hypothetical protein
MIRAKIDVTKIDKSAMFKGTKGTYLDITLLDNRDGTDEYGNDGFIVQDIGKERRENGEKGPIIGNWKNLDKDKKEQQKRQAPQAKPTVPAKYEEDPDDSIPF